LDGRERGHGVSCMASHRCNAPRPCLIPTFKGLACHIYITTTAFGWDPHIKGERELGRLSGGISPCVSPLPSAPAFASALRLHPHTRSYCQPQLLHHIPVVLNPPHPLRLILADHRLFTSAAGPTQPTICQLTGIGSRLFLQAQFFVIPANPVHRRLPAEA